MTGVTKRIRLAIGTAIVLGAGIARANDGPAEGRLLEVEYATTGCAGKAEPEPSSRVAPPPRKEPGGERLELRGTARAVAYWREAIHSCGRDVVLSASRFDGVLEIRERWSGVEARCHCRSEVSGLVSGLAAGELDVRVIQVWEPPPGSQAQVKQSTLIETRVLILDDGSVDPDMLAREFAARYSEVLSAAIPERVVARVIRDLDRDGLEDLLLSCSSEWGSAGGFWSIFLARPGEPVPFRDVGQVFFHSEAVRFEKGDGLSTRLIAYVKGGGGGGRLTTSVIDRHGVRTVLEEPMRAEGPDRARYDELFGSLRSEPVVWSTRLTGLLGLAEVVWRPGGWLDDSGRK